MKKKNRFDLGIWFQNQKLKILQKQLRGTKDWEDQLKVKEDIKVARTKRNTLYRLLVLYKRTGRRI